VITFFNLVKRQRFLGWTMYDLAAFGQELALMTRTFEYISVFMIRQFAAEVGAFTG
jgi:hypothetical protein